MMVNDGIQVDASQCYALFRRLNSKNRRKVDRTALRAAANKVKNQAVRNLQQVIGHSVRRTTTYTRANGKTLKRSLAKGIRVVSKDSETAKVHIMGDYRLKFFEMVPDDLRKTSGRRGRGKKIPLRKSSNRGPRFKDQSKHGWFERAVKAKEPEAARDIEEALKKHILKQANREGITLN